eukprot:m.178126 g.178126  ORF g.178126 m.178126 type:complete len:548 (+) comp15465_c0_seq4:252-1895(+)
MDNKIYKCKQKCLDLILQRTGEEQEQVSLGDALKDFKFSNGHDANEICIRLLELVSYFPMFGMIQESENHEIDFEWMSDEVLCKIASTLKILSRERSLALIMAEESNFSILMQIGTGDIFPASLEAIRTVVNLLLQLPEAGISAMQTKAVKSLVQLTNKDGFTKLDYDYQTMIFRALFLMVARNHGCCTAALDLGAVEVVIHVVEVYMKKDTLVHHEILTEAFRFFFKMLTFGSREESSDLDEQKKKIANFSKIASFSRKLLTDDDLKKYPKLSTATVTVLMGAPSGCGGHIIGREADSHKTKLNTAIKATEITERQWDPDNPEKEVEMSKKVISHRSEADIGTSDHHSDDHSPLTSLEKNHVDALITYLEQQVHDSEAMTPIANILRLLCLDVKESRKYIRDKILPKRQDFSQRPEKGNSLSAQLVRLLTEIKSEVTMSVAHLLFLACNENASRLIRRTGFGNAAGFLAGYGIMNFDDVSQQNKTESDSESESDESINPVTGTVWEEETESDRIEMSEKEKEEAAEQLMAMFARLDQLGIIKPQFK